MLDNPFMPKSRLLQPSPTLDVTQHSANGFASISYANAFRLYPELAERIG